MQLNVLTDPEIETIHDASLQILRDTGIHVPHQEMRRLFLEAGAAENRTDEIVKIPEKLVYAALESAGKSFTLFGRDLSQQAQFGSGTRNYNSAASEVFWVDDSGTRRRYATLEDVALATRFGDSLSWLNLVGAMADPHEISPMCRSVVTAAEQIKHTTKPIYFFFHNRSASRYLLEIMAAVRGSEEEATRYPLFCPMLEPISPLKFPHDGIDLLFETSRFSLPVLIGPMALEIRLM